MMEIHEKNTQVMLEKFSSLRIQLDELRSRVDPLQNLNAQKAADLDDAIFCMQLSLTFYAEANAAAQAGAWFAAATVAASALEAVLLGRCFLHQDKIRALPKWRSIKKSYSTNFGAFARSLDLGKLLDIALQLSWFPTAGMPETFRKTMSAYCDQPTMDILCAPFQNNLDIGQTCATHLREYRNLIHPAVCLKEGRQPSPEAGLTATIMFLMSVSALSEGTI